MEVLNRMPRQSATVRPTVHVPYRIGSSLCALLLGIAADAHAQHEPSIAVWYRSGAECPDGSAFLQALEQRSVRARLAQVGDAIDFVVTVGPTLEANGAAGMRGVLERQTETGTVAIRTVDDPSCGQVAEALSLTLALAVQSDAPASAPSEAPAPATPTAAVPAPAVVASPSVEPSLPPQSAPPVEEPSGGMRLSIGILGSAATGIAPALQPGGQLFVELASRARSSWRPALRLGAFAAYGSGSRQDRPLSVRTLGGRIEASPLQLAFGPIALRPSLALELGQLHSKGGGSTGRTDSGLWASSELSARANVAIAQTFSLEAQLGLALPWTRFELRSADGSARVAHETAAVSLAARIGAVVHFP
jgi:hypothetical protein